MPVVKKALVYPSQARSSGQSGYVDLKYNVDKNGIPTDVEVTRGEPGTVFDEAAIRAVTKFRHLPRIRSGEAVSVSGVKVRVRFELED